MRDFLFAAYEQNLHGNGLSPVCVLICLLISAELLITFEQMGQAHFCAWILIVKAPIENDCQLVEEWAFMNNPAVQRKNEDL